MSKINVLDSSIFNRIAAGEVVERPSSVLKELLDNSIDAGAQNITVYITEGGIKNITVIDDGSGIEYDQLHKVFLPHSTSKISCVDDLDKIGTLGFRGEALASIASVSEVELIAKTKSSDFGGKITINNGNNQTIEQTGSANGTKISVSNLFYNIPARAKFLKKPRQEATELTNLMSRYILVNPNIKFTYYVDEQEVYSSTGNGMFEAIYTVYGKQTTENILKVDFKHPSGIEINGYISTPTFSKANRTYQTLSINGRYVTSAMISTCVYNAFERYLMKNQFPFFVLNIQMPLDKLDVNVHPNKMEVRFENSNNMYGIVYQAVILALEQANKVTTVETKVFEYEKQPTKGISFSDNLSTEQQAPQTIEFKTNVDAIKKQIIDNAVGSEDIFNKDDFVTISSNNGFNSNLFTTTNNNQINFDNHVNFEQNVLETHENNIIDTKINEEIETSNNQLKIFNEKSYNFIGTIFNTYLLFESEDCVYVIDQHAAHERLLFDKLVKQVNDKNVVSQYLLIPYTFNVNNLEKQFMLDNLDSLISLGFEISEFGNDSFKVSSIPQVLAGLSLKQYFDNLFAEISIFKNVKQADLVLEKLMQHSCKTAVKAGDKLSSNEVEKLLKNIDDTSMQLQCPHGRPIVVKLSKKEIEKWFKRIV